MPLDPKQIEEWQATIAAGNVIYPSAHGALSALLSERAELLALLREVEWKSGAYREDSRCPACFGLEPLDSSSSAEEGHAPDCRLAAFLR
jgi:hypothetical protein